VLKIFLSLFFLAASVEASAEFLHGSSSDFGSNTLTIDTDTGLRWLSPVVTVGYSYNEVSRMLLDDGRFSGYRFATMNELEVLFGHAGIEDINDPGRQYYGTKENVDGVGYLQSFTCITYTYDSGLFETAGFLGSPYISPVNGFKVVHMGGIGLHMDVLGQWYGSAATIWSNAQVGDNYEGVGAWLVTSVPELDTWFQMLLGLVVFGVASRRLGSNAQQTISISRKK
jgi:hypothetical protein